MLAVLPIMHAITILAGNATITRDSKFLGGIGCICRYFICWTFLVAIIGLAYAFVLCTTVLKKHFIISNNNTTFTIVMIVSSWNYFYRFSLPSAIGESAPGSGEILSITIEMVVNMIGIMLRDRFQFAIVGTWFRGRTRYVFTFCSLFGDSLCPRTIDAS